MPITDADLETVGLSADPRFIALIERSRAFYKPGTGIPLEEIRRKHGRSAKPRKATRRRRGRSTRPSR